MPPFPQQSGPACVPRRASGFAGLGLGLDTTNSTLADSDERPGCDEFQFSTFLIGNLSIFFGVIFLFIIVGWASKVELGWGCRLVCRCFDKARNAFTKMKSVAMRRNGIPEDVSDAAAVATRTLPTGHGQKAASSLSDVELDVMGTPVEVRVTECTGEGKV
ncbi:uncharacterized protein Triagg1_5864 [Trichoderma aggressivum f. europaeum]|uniref:Uncharacterized protein n=1 Tax=Trichoderma aggressivum f. europaeum TaxID=173218 RepID=A0AAE1IEE6_9HYPO|nr:hypothetical protein Triagg1_5864 [Trichoderma aggressivum f. europaeum]